MDSRSREITLVSNNRIQISVNRLIHWSGTKTTVVLFLMLLVLIGINRYAKHQLEQAGGYYRIPIETRNDKVYFKSQRLHDTSNIVDDKIALVQDFATKSVTKIFSHSTTSYTTNMEAIQSEYTENAFEDLLVNLERLNYSDYFKRGKVVIAACNLRNGIPLIVDYALAGDFDDEDEIVINDTFTLIVKAHINVNTVSGTEYLNNAIEFTMDVKVLSDNYRKTDYQITRMSLWKVK